MTELVNTTTGEIAKSPESVVEFLENAKWALDVAVEMTGPSEVALMKAQIVMAETYARELSLSKDIQEQAREMVRRAEYALGRAIRKGQEEGTVRKQGQGGGQPPWTGTPRSDNTMSSPLDFASHSELLGQGSQGNGIYALSEVRPEEFEAALDDAKSEGNLSRANVVRKIRGDSNPKPVTREQRADVIADLATQGYTSHQMAARVGVAATRVREIARSFEIDIPADRAVGRQRQIDHTAAMDQTVTSLENWASALHDLDFAEVDFRDADEWVASLSQSASELRRFINKIKETTHV